MTTWAKREPGEGDAITYDVSEEMGVPGYEGAIMIAPTPDWIKHPTTGAKLRVTAKARHDVTCPMCHTKVTGSIVSADDLHCLDCPSCKQYVWFGTTL